jgi:hypothetical protein
MRWITVAVVCCSILVTPATAAAACRPADQRHINAGQDVATNIQRYEPAGAADVRRALAAATRHCHLSRYARGLAIVWRNERTPRPGERASWRGIPYIGRVDGAVVRWRYDVPRAMRIARQSSQPRNAISSVQELAGRGSQRVTWSWNPARHEPDLELQAMMARALGGSVTVRRLQRATFFAFDQRSLRSQLQSRPVHATMHAAVRIHRAAISSRDPQLIREASRISRIPALRLPRTIKHGWSVTEGSWSSLASHKAYVQLGSQLATLRNDRALARSAARLGSQLRQLPTITFQSVPTRPFLPWPKDGVADASAAVLAVDKPISVVIDIHSLLGVRVRTITTTATPGSWRVRWDGTNDAGVIQPPGEYTYHMRITDIAGNRRNVPGINSFAIIRDTTPAQVVAATARFVGGTRRRSFRVSWKVREVQSPMMTIDLVLLNATGRHTIRIPSQTVSGTTVASRRRIPAGTWRAVVRFTDGSGNRSSRSLGPISVR